MRQEELSEIHRQWLLTAVMKLAGEQGVSSLTVAAIADRAGVSNRVFRAQFEDCEACLLAAMEHAVARTQEVVGPAYHSQTRWRESIRAGLAALLEFFEREPAVGRLCVVDSLAGGPAIREYRMSVLASVIAVVSEGRARRSGSPGNESSDFHPPPIVAEGIAGAALHLVHSRLTEQAASQGPGEPLSALLNPLMSMIVLPYLGEDAASQELHMPMAPVEIQYAEPFASSRIETFEDRKMRLTYRTIMVLRAVESSPGSSNNEIASAAGITDPGQISKLLSRLSGLEMIHNGAIAPAKGVPNVWRLTDRGERFMRSIGILGLNNHRPDTHSNHA